MPKIFEKKNFLFSPCEWKVRYQWSCQLSAVTACGLVVCCLSLAVIDQSWTWQSAQLSGNVSLCRVIPTDLFTFWSLKKPSERVPEQNRIRRLTDFEATKLNKSRLKYRILILYFPVIYKYYKEQQNQLCRNTFLAMIGCTSCALKKGIWSVQKSSAKFP